MARSKQTGYTNLESQFLDVEAQAGPASDFSYEFMDKQVRAGFIRKVFGILGMQLLVTCAISALFITQPAVKAYVVSHQWTLMLAYVTTLVLVLAMVCVQDLRRTYPLNYAFLGTFTIAESYLVGAISCQYDTNAVVLAAVATGAICVGLAAFAMQTKYDVTSYGGFLFSFVWGFIMFGFFAMFLPASGVLTGLYACIGAVIFGFYLIYDIQIMMHGKKYTLSPDEYVFAALNLYLDVINMFMYILSLLNRHD